MGKKKKKHTIDVQFITACISTSLVLLLLGTVAFFMLTANNLSVYVRENLELSALIHDGTSPSDVDKLVKRVSAKPYAKEVRFISKDEVLQQETTLMGVDPTEFLGFNPYTASLEIRLKADYANADSLRWIGESLRHEACISDISYPNELSSTSRSTALWPVPSTPPSAPSSCCFASSSSVATPSRALPSP